MKVVSIKNKNEYYQTGLEYIQSKWASEATLKVYEDCLSHCTGENGTLPQWYLLLDDDKNIVGCAGLITNDFISRMDLYPWFCALYVEEDYRGHHYGSLLMEAGKKDAKNGGFSHMHLCTDHIGYYEKYGFEYVGDGYHPWGESSRIYSISVE